MKKRPPTIGSLDHFEDMADKLDELGCAYMLIVGIPNTNDTHSWSNIAQFGEDGIEEFCNTFEGAIEQQIEQILEDGDNDPTLN